MSDETEAPEADEPPTSPTIPVMINIPVGLLSSYDDEVEAGLYVDREAALLDALVEAWRHHKGRYSTLRVDVRLPPRPGDRPNTDEPDLDDVAAAADELRDAEDDPKGDNEGA